MMNKILEHVLQNGNSFDLHSTEETTLKNLIEEKLKHRRINVSAEHDMAFEKMLREKPEVFESVFKKPVEEVINDSKDLIKTTLIPFKVEKHHFVLRKMEMGMHSRTILTEDFHAEHWREEAKVISQFYEFVEYENYEGCY